MDAQINIHQVATDVELDERIVSNLHSANVILSTEDDLAAAAQILNALRKLHDGDALVIWRGTNPL